MSPAGSDAGDSERRQPDLSIRAPSHSVRDIGRRGQAAAMESSDYLGTLPGWKCDIR